MAVIRFACPACAKSLECDAELLGALVKCPECGKEVTVPEARDQDDRPPKTPVDEEAADAPGAESEPADEGEQEEEQEQDRKQKPQDEEEEGGEEQEEEGDEEDEAIADYLTDGQPAKAVRKAFDRIDDFLKEEEEIEYIAVQHNPINPLDNIEPGCVILTSRRFIICRPKLLGRMEFRGFQWYDVTNLRLSEKLGGATIAFRTIGGEIVSADLIPKNQARHLYSTAQQFYEAAREERRRRPAEQPRARAVEQHRPPAPTRPNPPPAKGDPVLRLKQLKEMLDLDLISAEDYAAKKKELLAEL
ncbi:MAG TPA: PH domain-containing protein [Verrucomicrobiae bacterium]|mgnify:CR=1 FL=1|nr:PH domain-containing protein [Verrucomicrobiae bacterium]